MKLYDTPEEIFAAIQANTATHEEVFMFVWRKLKGQGQKSLINEIGSKCAYRGNNGTKCAAGWLIPDSVYKKDFESLSIELIFAFPEVPQATITFIGALQQAHDYTGSLDFAPMLYKNMDMLRLNYDLNIIPTSDRTDFQFKKQE